MKKSDKNPGFVLIELLVVISVIGLLSSIILVTLNGARAQARDARRISDMLQIRTGINLYMAIHNQYPQAGTSESGECNGGWDSSGDGDFLPELTAAQLFKKDLLDPSLNGNNGGCGNYQYAHYDAGDFGCDPKRGRFYVLQVVDMETVLGTPGNGIPGISHKQSPGFSCPDRNWTTEWAEYVIGEFEK